MIHKVTTYTTRLNRLSCLYGIFIRTFSCCSICPRSLYRFNNLQTRYAYRINHSLYNIPQCWANLSNKIYASFQNGLQSGLCITLPHVPGCCVSILVFALIWWDATQLTALDHLMPQLLPEWQALQDIPLKTNNLYCGRFSPKYSK